MGPRLRRGPVPAVVGGGAVVDAVADAVVAGTGDDGMGCGPPMRTYEFHNQLVGWNGEQSATAGDSPSTK
ncbi:hypothetical protein ACE1SV_31180 [Streptomyces sennicomposti]